MDPASSMKVTTIAIPTIAVKAGAGPQDHPQQPADDNPRQKQDAPDADLTDAEAVETAIAQVTAHLPGLGHYVNKVV
jgi:hypothetical protein